MKLSELVDTPGAIVDPCRMLPSMTVPPRPKVTGVGGVRHLVLVEQDEGHVEYMFLYPDGHLGSVTD